MKSVYKEARDLLYIENNAQIKKGSKLSEAQILIVKLDFWVIHRKRSELTILH